MLDDVAGCPGSTTWPTPGCQIFFRCNKLKWGKNIPNDQKIYRIHRHKIHQMAENVINGHKLYQHFQVNNIPKLGFMLWKVYHLANVAHPLLCKSKSNIKCARKKWTSDLAELGSRFTHTGGLKASYFHFKIGSGGFVGSTSFLFFRINRFFAPDQPVSFAREVSNRPCGSVTPWQK
jgi:hypothetical protein